MPLPVCNQLLGLGFGQGSVLAVAAGIGLALTIVFTWWIRKSSDWLCLMVPATAGSLVWTYVQPASHVMAWLPLAVLAVDLLRRRDWCDRALIGLTMICLARLYYIGQKAVIKLGLVEAASFEEVGWLLSDVSALLAFVGVGIWAWGFGKRSMK